MEVVLACNRGVGMIFKVSSDANHSVILKNSDDILTSVLLQCLCFCRLKYATQYHEHSCIKDVRVLWWLNQIIVKPLCVTVGKI